MRYEYRIEKLTLVLGESLADRLNELGAQGWRLKFVEPIVESQGALLWFLFEREIDL